jgi:ABC-type nitrate/sulfonate/bicarbonate transport system substrate-binding protein
MKQKRKEIDMFAVLRRNIIVASLIGLLGVAGALPAFDTKTGQAQELQTIRITLGPYFEYQPWTIAQELGLDKEMGLNFELLSLSKMSLGVAGLQRGDYDLISACQTCTIPFYENVPSLRNWLVTNQFKGFAIVGRNGQTETYAELAPKIGHDKAKEQILRSFEGKTFAIVKVNHGPLVDFALRQVGLSIDDVTILNFPDHPTAGFAFQGGEGDYYTGALPQQIRLLTLSDEFVNVGGHEILGPAGLWYSTMLSDQPWLDANEETALKMLAIWYRTMRYVKERREFSLPIWTKSLNNVMGSDTFTVEQTRIAIAEFEFFPTMEEAAEGVFNPESDLHWRNSVEHYLPSVEDVPDGFDADTYEVSGKYYALLRARADLVEWINAPLK